MGNSQDPITLHKYLYANGNPVSNVDPTGYFSMMSMSGAMGIANTLRNGQTEAYSQFANVVTGGWDGVSWDNLPEIAATAVGIRLLFRFSPKFKKWFECKNSFDGATLIATESGLIPIENIKIGDKVWAYNESNQTKSLQEVTHLIKGEGTKELVDIKLSSGEVITATSNHPFWEIERQVWVDAEELTADSVLLNLNDGNTTIKSLKHYEESKRVYNLTVGNDHTYYVGVGGILGHNACSIDETAKVKKVLKKNRSWQQYYDKAKKLLKDGKQGRNQHPLTRDRKGEWAMDLGGSNDRGGMRIIYTKDDDKITIKDITDYHP